MSDTNQPEGGRCKHVMTEQLGTRFLTRKEAAILRRRPKKETPAHEPAAGTEGDAIEFEREEDGRWIAEAPAHPGAMAYGNTKDEAQAKVEALTQSLRPEPAGLPELMHADAVTKLELWKQNQALLQQLEALKQSHAALVKALEKIVRIMGDPCPYAGECANHSSGDCIECTARAVLADAQKVTHG